MRLGPTQIEVLIWKYISAIATLGLAVFIAGALAPARAEEAPGENEEIVILAFGDSLTAGYQLPPDAAFPAQLEAALRTKGRKVRVVNSGVSGDTTASAFGRLEWSLNEKVDAVIIELGANDALRGLAVNETEETLGKIIEQFKARDIEILLVGMEAPRNWGEAYVSDFRAMYERLAARHGVPLYPFFLKDVATVAALNLPDGLHPTAKGVAVVVQNILPNVEPLIERVREKRRRRKG